MTVFSAVALPLIPAALGIVGLLLPLSNRVVARRLAIAGTALPLAAALWLLLSPDTTVVLPLADFGDVTVAFALRVDTTAAAVAVAVTTVALLVQLYSISYLADDERYAPYAAQVALFTAAMLLVVVADDLILLLIGWEVMGACSYLLIGHDRRLTAAPAAAVKAFLVTRVGDVGFLLGIVLLAVHTGTFRVGEAVAAAPEALSAGTLTAVCLLILAGAAGKSAQFPLHTWLPDAMAGPTPISALIHAATMVAAGAYVLVRLLDLYAASPTALIVVACGAAVTMLLAAYAALASDDFKRVLAWSTVSQVGYMFAAVAVTAGSAAIGHLLSHAAFKALLFLGAGAVIHMVGTNSMSRMGGLRHGAPVTFWTMTIGFAALAGVPLLSGFWTKEAVLAAASEGGAAAWIVLVAGIATAGLTAAYATRAWLRTFFGHRRDENAHVVDPVLTERVPLLVLAGATVLGSLGLTGYYVVALFTGAESPLRHPLSLLLVVLVSAAGAYVVYRSWRRDTDRDPALDLRGARETFARGFYLDEVQHALVVKPVRLLARLARRADTTLVDGAVEGSGRVAVHAATGLTAAHRAGVPRHLLTALGGAALIGVLAVAALWGVL